VKVKFDYLYLFCLSGDHDANCPACFDICPGICGMDSDYFEPMFEAFGPDLFPFADCLHYHNINAYLASLRDDYEPGADYDMFWTPERAHFDDEGCSYGTLWVNDKEIEIGFSGGHWGHCFEMADSMRYQVADYSTGSKDIAYIPLDRYDSLVIGMNWYDEDLNTDDDRMCLGEYTYYPRDIEEIASMDNQEKTYERVFVERGGGCVQCSIQSRSYLLIYGALIQQASVKIVPAV